MKSITHTFEKINDSLNPIVVKELKQAVQGKFLIVVLMLLLVVQLFTMGVFLANKSASFSFDIGRTIFTVLLGILAATCLLFVPAYTGIRLASERSDANVDLLFITTLRPRSIIWGKLLAALILTVLLYSACMPFMTFTYLLRGIDLPSIFILLAFNFIIIAIGIQSAILIGCIPANRVFKAILGVLWLAAVVGIFFATTLLSGELLNAGIGSRFDSWLFWRGVLSVLGVGVALIGLLALLSTAVISPLSANRALPVRVFVTHRLAVDRGRRSNLEYNAPQLRAGYGVGSPTYPSVLYRAVYRSQRKGVFGTACPPKYSERRGTPTAGISLLQRCSQRRGLVIYNDTSDLTGCMGTVNVFLAASVE